MQEEEELGSPERTFKFSDGDRPSFEYRDVSTPFTTTSAEGLGLTEAPPAPRKTKKSPSAALRSREMRLKGLGDSGGELLPRSTRVSGLERRRLTEI